MEPFSARGNRFLDLLPSEDEILSLNASNGALQKIPSPIADDNSKGIQAREMIRLLTVAVKLLLKMSLNEGEKKSKKTAAKILNFYKADAKAVGKEALAGALELVCRHLVDREITAYSLKNPPVSKDEILWFFKNIENDYGHLNDGNDLFRHLMRAIIELYDGGQDLYEKYNVDMRGLEGEQDHRIVKPCFVQRLEVLLKVFVEKISCSLSLSEGVNLEAEVSAFLGKLINNDQFDTSGEMITSQMNSWRHGTNAQKLLACLMFTLSQFFTVSVMEKGPLGLINTISDRQCPHLLLKLGALRLTPDRNSKKIKVIFCESEVLIKHTVSLRSEGTPGLEVKQVVILHSSVEDLSMWNCAIKCIVRSDGALWNSAEKINRIYGKSGIDTVLIHSL
jgi:hypothetical protein